MYLSQTTIWVITIVVFLSLAAILIVFKKTAKDFPEFNDWIYSFAVFSISFFLISLRGKIHNFISILLADILIIISTQFIYTGMKKAYDCKSLICSSKINVSIIFTTTLLLFYFYFNQGDTVNITLTVSLGYGIILFNTALIPLFSSKRKLRIIDLFAFIGILPGSIISFYRIGYILINHINAAELINDKVFFVVLLNSMISAIFGTFVFIFIVSTKTYDHLLLVNARLKSIADCDDLTGAIQRRRLEQIADQHIRISKRTEIPVALILFDVDDFKKLNDVYGHLAGDDVLRGLVEICQNNLREVDSISRFGGEEFIIFLPGCNRKSTVIVLKKIMKLFKNGIKTETAGTLPITISAGITVLKKADNSVYDMIKRSDECLYKAKRSGKNKYYLCL